MTQDVQKYHRHCFSRRFLDFNQQGLAIYSAHFRLLFY